MAAAALLARLIGAGLSVSRDGDRLIVVPRDRLTEELREAIRNGKGGLLEVLLATQTEGSRGLANSLEDRIRAMAGRWGYSAQDVADELAFAGSHPHASVCWIERDEAQWIGGVFDWPGAML